VETPAATVRLVTLRFLLTAADAQRIVDMVLGIDPIPAYADEMAAETEPTTLPRHCGAHSRQPDLHSYPN
jgi:hypothetical protein